MGSADRAEAGCPLCAGAKGCAVLGASPFGALCTTDVESCAPPSAAAAALFYAVPLAALMTGALGAIWFAGEGTLQRDLYAAGGAAVGLALSFAGLRRYRRRLH